MSTSIVGQGERPSRSLYDVFCLYCDGEVVPPNAVIYGNITKVYLRSGYTTNITEDDWKRVGIGNPPARLRTLFASLFYITPFTNHSPLFSPQYCSFG